MKQNKFLKVISLVLLVMFTFASCSKSGKAISQAFLKTAEIKTYTFDSSANVHLEFPGALMGLEDSFPIDLEISSTGAYEMNADKLPTALVNMNFNVMDLMFDAEFYIEPSIDDEKNLEYYIKMPKFMKAALGYGTKKEEYLKYNLKELISETTYFPFENDLYEQVLSSQETALQMNKDVFDILQSLGNDDSLKDLITDKGYQELKRRNGNMFAKTYEINLNNENLKPLLMSIVSNDEAIKKLLNLSTKYSYGEEDLDINAMMSDFEANKEMILSQIEHLPNLFGEKGLTCTFSISNGYIVYQKYDLDINVENMLIMQGEIENSYYDINRSIEIERPEIDGNSINAVDLLGSFDDFTTPLEEEPSENDNTDSLFMNELQQLQTTGRLIEDAASDYFYPTEKLKYHYTDENGNESFLLEVEDFGNNKIQCKYTYPDAKYSAIYSTSDDIISLIYFDEYSESTNLTTEENYFDNILFTSPLKEGNYLVYDDNSISYLSSIDTEITTPSGTYTTIEFIDFYNDDNYRKRYYAKGVGLVKTITNYSSADGVVTSTIELSKIEK